MILARKELLLVILGAGFIASMLLAYFFNGCQYECALPNGGYLIIRWNAEAKKIDMLRWQPKGPAKQLPKKTIRLHGAKPAPPN
ncbi:MAG: hypothetical protein NC924_05745 [Candidatus Omnitrophica bacterium]|nr:hypothetical protein [Candidatus Omnitrophota bacterium]